MASPEPVEVVEAGEIQRLLDAGEVVVACGGGGVPVARVGDDLVGVNAVIDKDFAAALIGRLVGATSLLLLTGVEQVHARLRHAATSARWTRMTAPRGPRRTWPTASSPPGSMGPKVEAAAQFVEGGGRQPS